MFYKHIASFNIFTPMTIFLIVGRCNKFIKVSLLELITSMIPISEGHINLMRCMARKHILHFKNKTGDKLQSNHQIVTFLFVSELLIIKPEDQWSFKRSPEICCIYK